MVKEENKNNDSKLIVILKEEEYIHEKLNINIKCLIDNRGGVWFIGNEVTRLFGYKNNSKALKDHVDKEEKGITKRYTLGGEQKVTLITEDGFYCLAIKSKMPNAIKFRKWVTKEVLPSLRKNNYYIDKENINQEQVENLQKELEETKNKLKDLRKDLDSLYLPFRNLGKSRREQFQKIIEDNLPSKPCAVAEITNLIYKNILGRTAREFKEELGVESVRDELTARELRLIEKAEELTMCFVFIQAFYGVDDDLIMAKLRYLLDTVEFVV